MTAKKPPSELKVRAKPEQLGGFEKTCQHCGETIHRKEENNLTWLRRAFCNKTCRFAASTSASWKRRDAT